MSLFHRLIVEEWQRIFTVASFAIFLTVFLIMLVHVFRISRGRLDHLSQLPLEREDQP